MKLLALAALAFSAPAFACRIHNDTAYDFTVESGNVSNQRVGPHTETSVNSGRILGKSKEGKTISGSCKEGDSLEIKEQDGVPFITVK